MTKIISAYFKSSSVAAIVAASLVLGVPAMAQQNGGNASGQGGSSQGAGQGSGQGAGQGAGQGSGQGGSGRQGQGGSSGSQSEQGSGSEGATGSTGQSGSSQSGSASAGSGSSGARGGGQGGTSLDDIMRDLEGDDGDEESDRPDWAGGGGGPNDRGGQPEGAGSTRGDMYGDLYVILRDDFGVPILADEGWVQPIDIDGNLVPLDIEGAPIDPTLAIPVELGRLNAGRSPAQVLDRRAEEVIALLNTATAIALDPSGRLMLTVDGVTKTIDSPLENMAIYVALMTEGTIPGVDDLPGTEFDSMVDGEFTAADLKFAAAFLAAASDKADTLTLDEIALINSFLGINVTRVGTVTYSEIDFTDYEYSRLDTFGDVTAEVLVLQPDGKSWQTETVNIYEVVFENEDYVGGASMASFTQAAEDARLIVNYIHEYAIPEDYK